MKEGERGGRGGGQIEPPLEKTTLKRPRLIKVKGVFLKCTEVI